MIRHVLISAVALALLASPALGDSGEYPDKDITPGLARPDATALQLCDANWAKTEKKAPASTRRDVFTAYRVSGNRDPACRSEGKKCRIDHLIARKLGGTDVAVNLWPQRTTGEWSAADKDRLEDCMHLRVCAQLAEKGDNAATRLLHIYQRDLVSDWIAAFKNVIGSRDDACSS
jgi:hypothetical protein